MKKVLVTILAFTYLAVSSGATLNLHYCMGRVVGWDVSSRQLPFKCGACGMKKVKHEGCCKDEHKTFQIDKDQKTVESSYQFLPLYSDAVIHHYPVLPALQLVAISTGNPVSHGPPLAGAIPIFLLHCHFRI